MYKLRWREKSKRVINTVITTAFLATQLLLPTLVIGQAHAATDNTAPTGNNGTLKVHEIGTPSGTESNDPKVCAFNFEGFDFDVGQSGYIRIEGQGQTNGTYGDYAFGPTTAAAQHTSYAVSQDFNNGGSTVTIPNGQYKATLYGKDTGQNINLRDEKAKSKVFKVNCVSPTKPTVTTAVSKSTVQAGDSVYDTATVTGDSDHGTVGGGVKFYLCGPAMTAPDCTTGGTAVGDSVPVSNGQAVSSNVSITSMTQAGTYCFRAEYTPAEGSKYLATKHTNRTTECFTVSKYIPPTPSKPGLAVDQQKCTPNSGETDVVKVTVTNTADATKATVTYTVKVSNATQKITLKDGESGTLTFSNLPTGPYTVDVTGDDATSASWGTGTVANCPKPTIKQCTSNDITEVSEQNLQGFSFSETRANGHNVFTSTGLHVYTDGSSDTGPRTDGGSGTWNTDKAAGYKASDISLADVGNPVLNYDKVGGAPNTAPGYQLYIDNGHGVKGYVVHEPDYYGNNWWSNANFNVGSGGGYTSYAPLSDYLAANPDARVLAFGYSLGSGVKGDVLLHSIEFNCHTYKFVKPDTAQIRVQKELWPANDKGKFNLNVDGQVKAANVGNGGDTGYVTVPVGKHGVSETAGTNTNMSNYYSEYKCYKETTWQPLAEESVVSMLSSKNTTSNQTVAQGPGTSVSNLQLNKDDKVTCVFKNKHVPTITIVKDARPNSSQAFSFDTNAQRGSFSLVDNGTNDGQQTKTFKVDGNGWYYFKEQHVNGWQQTQLSCDGGSWHNVFGTLVVSADYGQNVTCTFVNTKEATVTIVKDAQPDSSQAFTFTSNLGGRYSQFNLTDDGKNAAAAQKQFTGVMPGSYTVSEGAMIGWTLSSVTCTNKEGAVFNGSTLTLRVQPGDDITCTYVNKMNTTPTPPTGGRGGDVLGASTIAATVTTPAQLANTGDDSLLATVIVGVLAIVSALGLTIATRKQLKV